MADLEFFFDPICPWAWITSRWVVEVAEQRDLAVDWKFIALRLVNEAKDYEKDFAPGYVNSHGGGRAMLRVAAAAREAAGNEAVGRFYTELGLRLHDGKRAKEVRDGDFRVIADAVEAAELDAALVEAGSDDSRDAVLREETELALSRTGPDVGTPIITFAPGTEREASFFGPVLASIPRGSEALAIFDAVSFLATTPGMYELKRTNRPRPTFG
jgi:hypothetical protein